MYPIEFYNYWTALGTVLLQLVSIVLLAAFLLRKKIPDLEDVVRFFRTWGLWIGLAVTLAATGMSLFYSEVLGIAPCSLCWLQRLFLYPQAVIFAVALIKKDRGAACYSIALSVFGAAIALYQHYLQMGGGSSLPCPSTADKAVDCHVRFLFEFNYVTFPLEAATIFAFLIVLMLFVRRTTST